MGSKACLCTMCVKCQLADYYVEAADLVSLQIEEVKGVTQVLDQEEEIAIQEFAKFEAKLREQRGLETNAPGDTKARRDSIRV